MRYNKERSVSFNLAAKLGKSSDHFGYFGASKIVKTLPITTEDGTVCAYDVVLGKNGDTILVVSLRRYQTRLPLIRGGKVQTNQEGKRAVADLMVATHSLSELGTTFDDVVSRGLDSRWITYSAKYFNTDSSDSAINDTIAAIRRDLLNR